MGFIKANEIERKISLVVFDKDGLMFKSQGFWAELGNERMRKLGEYVDAAGVAEWAELFGLECVNGEVVYADPKGILAVASPREEVDVTAGVLVKLLKWPWAKARDAANDVFHRANVDLNLRKALVPTKGFPDILKRLRDGGIPYAVATSDTKERVIDSFKLVGEEPPEIIVFPDMVAKGKPNPDMLLLISQMTNIPTEEMAMVGDSYVDVKMAASVGAFGIGVPETDEMRETMKEYTDAIVDTLDDILIL